MQKIICFLIPCFITTIACAEDLCPPASAIKNTQLIKPMRHKYDPDLWDFTSNSFWYNGSEWNVWFGTFFPNTNTKSMALFLGNRYFLTAKIVSPTPTPIRIPAGIYCEYVPPGDTYWISAMSPPS